MFIATFKDPKILKHIIESINKVIVETTLKISENGIEILAMDSVHVIMLHLNLNRSDFAHYEISDDCDGQKLGLNLTDFLKIIKRAGSDDEISLTYSTGDGMVSVVMRKEGQKKKKTLSLNTISLDVIEPPIKQLLEIPSKFKIRLDTKFILEAAGDGEIYSDALLFQMNEADLTFKADGSTGQMEYVLEKEEYAQEYMYEKCEMVYTISKLKNCLLFSQLNDIVDITGGEDAPLGIYFNILTESSIQYFLAPRVDQAPEEY